MAQKVLYGDERQLVSPPEGGAMEEVQPTTLSIITKEDIAEAAEILAKYKSGKANLETRIIEDEQWYKIQHWKMVNSGKTQEELEKMNVKTSSGWLFNTIANKHADAMDNYPEPIVLPREPDDEGSAKILSSVLPVVMEQNDFQETYSDESWEKEKHGTSIYGVFWNSEKYNGLGDIDIRGIDVLNIFWEPGIKKIQKSRNLFIVEMVDTDILEQDHPELKGRLNGVPLNVSKYIYDDTVDTSGKSVVVDWYYKRKLPSGRTVLHYVKFVNNDILFASENMQEFQETGYYAHGKYPVVFDVLFPEKDTPHGFGFVSICRDPQLYYDALSSNLLEWSKVATKIRFLKSDTVNINLDQLKDTNEQVIDVTGTIDPQRIQQLTIEPPSAIYQNIMTNKVDEMKETAFNRDVTSGGSSSGITAASAIAALQEAGNKQSRDMISQSYRAYTEVCQLCIELMRQFYDTPRTFRIAGEMAGQYRYAEISSRMIGSQVTGEDLDGNPFYRIPIFDLKVKAQKRNPFSRMESNERAKELYSMGFFNPERAQEALVALEMMDFEGKEKVVEQIKNGQTLLALVEQQSQIISQLTGMMAPAPGMTPAPSGQQSAQPQSKSGLTNKTTDGIMESRAPMTGYGQRLAKRSVPDMNTSANTGAAVR